MTGSSIEIQECYKKWWEQLASFNFRGRRENKDRHVVRRINKIKLTMFEETLGIQIISCFPKLCKPYINVCIYIIYILIKVKYFE